MAARWVDMLAADLIAATENAQFSGVVLLQHEGQPVLELAAGMADRAESRRMTIETRLATASGTKGFTALAAVSLIEDGVVDFNTPLRAVVGDTLPNVDQAVTIEHLLGHTSGVGDYLDEEQLDSSDDYVLDVPVHTLQGPRDYVPILNHYRQRSLPGEKFTYNNSGYVMLALAIECAANRPYHDVIRQRVFEPAAMTSTDFFRSDHLPSATALGYLSDGRTNVLHLPVIGTGDGGAYTTGPDMLSFWDALLAGSIVAPPLVERMTTPNHCFSDKSPADEMYGLGLWIGSDPPSIFLEGGDAGVSLRSGVHLTSGLGYCLIANNDADVWPLARIIDGHMSGQPH